MSHRGRAPYSIHSTARYAWLAHLKDKKQTGQVDFGPVGTDVCAVYSHAAELHVLTHATNIYLHV